ncbi:MAG: glycosyltransferase family 39 protein [Spirochaetota bacterium]|jgi:hypothetical protein|nr:glycosyltransferase family 39 protein [Spirochaetota bacterium]
MLKKSIPFIIILLIALFVYREGIFQNDTVLFSGDYHTSVVTWQQKALADSKDGSIWYRDYMAGWPEQVMSDKVLTLVFKLFDPYTALSLAYFFGTFLVGIFFYFYLRSMNLSRAAALFGAVSLMLSNHFLTKIFPGHLAKFMTFIWIPLVFLFLRKAAKEDAWTHYIYSGFFFGLALAGQFYEAVLFFGALALCYWIYLLAQKRPEEIRFTAYYLADWKNLLRHKLGFASLVIIMVMIGVQLLPQIAALSGTTEGLLPGSQEKWEFATSWSLPPEETIELFVPGIFGWKTSDSEVPYWGRMGKPSVPYGYKLNAENVGVATLFLAMLALIFFRKKRGSEAVFWFWAIIVTLIFSFGRHLPALYWFFYQIPYMDTIRNPNKVLWPTMFAFSILGAMGLHLLFAEDIRKQYADKFERFLKAAQYLAIGFAGMTLLAFAASGALRGTVYERLSLGQSQGLVDPKIVEGVLDHIPLAFLLAAVFAAAAYFLCRVVIRQNVRDQNLKYIAAALIALAALDLWLSGRHYIQYSSRETTLDYNAALAVDIRDNQVHLYFDRSRPDPVVAFLKERMRNGRVWVERNFVTDVYFRDFFPYHEISCANFNPNPRRPERYREFMQLTDLHAKPPSADTLARIGVRYVLSLERSESTNASLPLIASFPLLTKDRIPLSMEFRIHEITNALPRVWLAHDYRAAQDYAESKTLFAASSLEDNRVTPIIETPEAPGFAKNEALPGSGADIEITHNGHTRLELSVDSAQPGLLMLLDAWHTGWKVRVNDAPGVIRPANLLFRAVEIPAGKSTILFEFVQKPIFRILEYLGFGIVFLAAVWDWVRRRKARAKIS